MLKGNLKFSISPERLCVQNHCIFKDLSIKATFIIDIVLVVDDTERMKVGTLASLLQTNQSTFTHK
jgi:hypothetical protein